MWRMRGDVDTNPFVCLVMAILGLLVGGSQGVCWVLPGAVFAFTATTA